MSRVPWVILHVPHASGDIPDDVRNELIPVDAEVARELARLTDHYTDELFAASLSGTTQIRFPVSRFVVDPERFADDAYEPMAGRGQGVIYTRTTDGSEWRVAPSPKYRRDLLERFYWPHHRKLTEIVGEALNESGRALIIDGHSFPDKPLPVDLDQTADRPDICIGTDEFHTPGDLTRALVSRCQEIGWSVGIDRPYSGTMVPTAYFKKDNRVASIMIEVNRRIYLTEAPEDVSKSSAWTEACAGVQSLIATAVQYSGATNS